MKIIVFLKIIFKHFENKRKKGLKKHENTELVVLRVNFCSSGGSRISFLFFRGPQS